MRRSFAFTAIAHLLVCGVAVAQDAPATALANGGQEATRQRLLELHDLQRKAHLDRDAELLVSMLAEDFVSIEDGVVEQPGHEAIRQSFERYFAAVEFLEWSDLAPPEITISTDGTLATIIVRKRVRLRPSSQPEAPIEETHFAWLETWRNRDGQWELTALASTRRSNEAGTPESASAGYGDLTR